MIWYIKCIAIYFMLQRLNSGRRKKIDTKHMIATPYDDVFRTLLADCSELIIPVVNEVFNEKNGENERVIFDLNEHFSGGKSGEQHKRITDSAFVITSDENEWKTENIDEWISDIQKRRYHIECETNFGIKILKREFEYDSQIALDNGIVSENKLKVKYPKSAVIFLRSKRNTPEKMNVEMNTVNGEINYDVHIMKVQSYSFDEIREKKLIFLLPFHIFQFENKFEIYDNDKRELQRLKEEYHKIREYLEYETKAEKIDEYTKCTIIDMTIKVVKNIAVKYPKIVEGVQEIMGGQVLDYEAKRILNEGKKIGEETGRRLGEEAIVKRMILSGMETKVIMDLSMMTEEQIEEIRKSME